MKVLFAVSNESISNSIVKKYQQMYKEIISSKNVYYFNAILKELQKDKTYDRIVISEDLEPFTNNNYEAIDNFIFEKLDSISDEASTTSGEDIPIILIATDRRTKSENLLIKLFGIGVYSTLIGQDRSVEEVCKLINKPRSKKEAKIYYKIDSNDVEYKSENDSEVSETEIQNILTYYKRLGRNEDRYVESFDSIASQYTDEQLKVIVAYLPLNVKAVLEANSPKYQQLISFSGGTATRKPGKTGYTPTSYGKTKMKNSTTKAVSNSGITVETIQTGEKKLTKPVIIPSTTARPVRKVRTDNIIENKVQQTEEPQETIIQQNNIQAQQEEYVEPVKRGRGRPKKIKTEEEIIKEQEKAEQPKRGRGRPRKNIVEEVEEENVIPGFEDYNEQYDESATLPGFEDDNENEPIDVKGLPGFEDDEDEIQQESTTMPSDEEEYSESATLPGFEEDDQEEDYKEDDDQEEDEMLPGFEETSIEENTMPGFETNSYENSNNLNKNYNEINSFNKEKSNSTQIETTSQQNYESANLENLLTRDKKIVSFVGTSKNGTSFLVNNLAEMLSSQGIKTAVLDLTKNRNAYYIYTKNEEDLRKTAVSCIEKLTQGIPQGIVVNKNLDIYTSLPGEDNGIDDYKSILTTLVKNYSLILLDCDFNTNYAYLKESQEIYLVQSMDVLTIQPFTAYLRDLKAKKILEQDKLRVVVNKYTKIRSVTEKTIIGGMAFYNDPAMSFMTELFNRETVPYCVIPFETQVYNKYLEGLINCNISLNGYTKEFINSLRKLANMVYPLIANTQTYNKTKYNNVKYNKYANNNSNATFSNNMNSTLDKMKRNY